MITVAFAAENNAYDAEIYRDLIQQILGVPTQIWSSPRKFQGWKGVLHLAPLHLEQAAQQGIRHALIAIDNDGGAKRRPPHDSAHNSAQESQNIDEGCAHCLLAQIALPSSGTHQNDLFHVLAVPVQTLETWLLVLRGDDLGSMPEHQYHRDVLKRKFFGKPFPPEEKRLALALEQIQKPKSLEILRQRPSFRLFEQQLQAWTSLTPIALL